MRRALSFVTLIGLTTIISVQPVAEADDTRAQANYAPTPQRIVDMMLEMAEVRKGDVVYDLGCGDGRIVVTAAKKYGVKAVGVDIDPKCVQMSLENVRKNRVEHLVTIKEADVFALDFHDATVVTLFLQPSLNARLIPQFDKLKPGSRIVSHEWDMPGAKPVKVVTVRPEKRKSRLNFEDAHTLFLWKVPLQKE